MRGYLQRALKTSRSSASQAKEVLIAIARLRSSSSHASRRFNGNEDDLRAMRFVTASREIGENKSHVGIMEEIVEEAMQKLGVSSSSSASGRDLGVRTIAILLATKDFVNETQGLELLPKLCRDLIEKKMGRARGGVERVRLIGGVCESVINGRQQTQNGISLTMASFGDKDVKCETFRTKADELPSLSSIEGWKEVIKGDMRGDSTLCVTFSSPVFATGGVMSVESNDDDEDDDESDDEEEKVEKRISKSGPMFRPTLDQFLTRLKHAVPNGLICFGGALENGSEKNSALFCDDDVFTSSNYNDGIAVGLLLYGSELDVEMTSIGSNERAIGPTFQVTSASRCGTEILELDYLPARKRILSVLDTISPDDLNRKVSIGVGADASSKKVGNDDDDNNYKYARGEIVSLGNLDDFAKSRRINKNAPKFSSANIAETFLTGLRYGAIEISGATVKNGVLAQIHVDDNAHSSQRELIMKKFSKKSKQPVGALFLSDVRANRMLAADFAEVLGDKVNVSGAYVRREIVGVGLDAREKFAVTKSSSTVLAFYDRSREKNL